MSQRIDTRVLIPLVIGMVAIAGIGLMAGALPNAASLNNSDEIDLGQDGSGINVTDGSPGEQNVSGPGNASAGGVGDGFGGITRCIEPLASTGGTLLVVLGFLGLVGLVYYRYNFSTSLLVGWTILPPIALVYFMLTNCGGGVGTGDSGGLPNIPGSNLAIDVAPNVPAWAVLGLVGVVFVAAVGLMYKTMGEDEVVSLQDEEMDAEPELDEFAEAAGRAADRIEKQNVDVDNAVYEAWVEMTGLIEVENPDVYSPGEFADTAIDLGMSEADVMELTELFNEVRYGDKNASAREDRAVSTLRSIEAAYGTDADTTEGDEPGGDAR